MIGQGAATTCPRRPCAVCFLWLVVGLIYCGWLIKEEEEDRRPNDKGLTHSSTSSSPNTTTFQRQPLTRSLASTHFSSPNTTTSQRQPLTLHHKTTPPSNDIPHTHLHPQTRSPSNDSHSLALSYPLTLHPKTPPPSNDSPHPPGPAPTRAPSCPSPSLKRQRI